MHNHGHCCEHNNLGYCKVCLVPYCKDCGKEWKTYNYGYQYFPYFGNTTTGGASSIDRKLKLGELGNTTTYKHEGQLEYKETVIEHNVTDYSFLLAGGIKFSIMVDHDAGDTINSNTHFYQINRTSKPDPVNLEETLAPETVYVNKDHILVLSTTDRKQRMATKEELLQNSRFIHEMAKGMH